MTMQATSAVHKTITVDAPIAHAFDVFTDRFDTWWPRSHHIGEAEMQQAVMEGRDGGRWYEIDVDGTECDWGRVITWDPPHHLVLAWQLDHEFHYDPDLVTTVEVRFTAETPTRTRVDLDHRDLDQFGEAEAHMREVFSSDGGWNGLLTAFAAAAAANAV